MTTSIDSQFRNAVKSRKAKEVFMNKFDIAFYSQSPSSIGTEGLGSCSVVLIVSRHAAILGHVSPQPDNANKNDLYAGENHVRSFMDQLTSFYQRYQAYFQGELGSWVVCAVYFNGVALPEQQQIMVTKLRDVGLAADTSNTYQVPTRIDHADRGSVFVDASGITVRVYVEGKMIQEMTKAATSTASHASTATSSTTTVPHSQQQGQQTQQVLQLLEVSANDAKIKYNGRSKRTTYQYIYIQETGVYQVDRAAKTLTPLQAVPQDTLIHFLYAPGAPVQQLSSGRWWTWDPTTRNFT